MRTDAADGHADKQSRAMSDVTLSIGGRRYKLACAAGEERHIALLGAAIDERLCANPALARQSEAQALLYASLLLADELHEQDAARAQKLAASDAGADFAEPLENLATRLEALADKLEQAGQSA